MESKIYADTLNGITESDLIIDDTLEKDIKPQYVLLKTTEKTKIKSQKN